MLATFSHRRWFQTLAARSSVPEGDVAAGCQGNHCQALGNDFDPAVVKAFLKALQEGDLDIDSL